MTQWVVPTYTVNMKLPKTIKFTDLEITPVECGGANHFTGLTPTSWTRVEFTIPTSYDALSSVQTWLQDNSANPWSIYDYSSKDRSQRTVVVRFKDKNDALMFKLRGGHQCWQDT